MNANDLLYHYTDAAGLLGIMGTPTKNAALWLSQAQFLNGKLAHRRFP